MTEIETVLAQMGWERLSERRWNLPHSTSYGEPPVDDDDLWLPSGLDANFVVERVIPWLHAKGVAWEIKQSSTGTLWCLFGIPTQGHVFAMASTFTEAVLQATAKAVEAGWFAE